MHEINPLAPECEDPSLHLRASDHPDLLPPGSTIYQNEIYKSATTFSKWLYIQILGVRWGAMFKIGTTITSGRESRLIVF